MLVQDEVYMRQCLVKYRANYYIYKDLKNGKDLYRKVKNLIELPNVLRLKFSSSENVFYKSFIKM